MAIGQRPVYVAIIKETWPMPILKPDVLDFGGSTFFAYLVFVSGYRQVPLHSESYAACVAVTPRGIIASKTVLLGLANAATHFQENLEPNFRHLRQPMNAWMDDFNLPNVGKVELLQVVEEFLKVCRRPNLLLVAKQCTFIAKQIRWCRRLTSADGNIIDPNNILALKEMEKPVTAEELRQYVYSCR